MGNAIINEMRSSLTSAKLVKHGAQEPGKLYNNSFGRAKKSVKTSVFARAKSKEALLTPLSELKKIQEGVQEEK